MNILFITHFFIGFMVSEIPRVSVIAYCPYSVTFSYPCSVSFFYQMVIYFFIILEYFYQYKVFYEINRIKNPMKLTRLFIFYLNFECHFLQFLLFALSKHT